MTKELSLRQYRILCAFIQRVIALYGYQFKIPYRQIAIELGNISHVSVAKYFTQLEREEFLKKQMHSRKIGVTYILNQKKIDRLISSMQWVEEYLKEK